VWCYFHQSNEVISIRRGIGDHLPGGELPACGCFALLNEWPPRSSWCVQLCLLVSIPDIAKASANNGAEAIPQAGSLCVYAAALIMLTNALLRY